VIRPVYFVFVAILFTFTLYINIIIVIVGIIISIIIISTGISKDRFVVNLYKKELYFVIYKGLKGFKDYNIICYLVFIYQVEV